MKDRLREFPLTVEEVRRLMKKEDAKRATWISIGIAVLAILVGLIVWIAKKREKDLEEHYEYFDDDFEDLDDEFDSYDESIYDDEEEEDQIEYVKINDFINDVEDEKVEETTVSTTEEDKEITDESSQTK